MTGLLRSDHQMPGREFLQLARKRISRAVAAAVQKDNGRSLTAQLVGKLMPIDGGRSFRGECAGHEQKEKYQGADVHIDRRTARSVILRRDCRVDKIGNAVIS